MAYGFVFADLISRSETGVCSFWLKTENNERKLDQYFDFCSPNCAAEIWFDVSKLKVLWEDQECQKKNVIEVIKKDWALMA